MIQEFLLLIDCSFKPAMRFSSRKELFIFCSPVLSKTSPFSTKQKNRSGVRRADVSTTFKQYVRYLNICEKFSSRRYLVSQKSSGKCMSTLTTNRKWQGHFGRHNSITVRVEQPSVIPFDRARQALSNGMSHFQHRCSYRNYFRLNIYYIDYVIDDYQ